MTEIDCSNCIHYEVCYFQEELLKIRNHQKFIYLDKIAVFCKRFEEG